MVAPTDVSLAEDKTIEGAAPRKKSITATTMSQAQDQRQRQQSFSQAKFKSKRSQSPKDSPTRLVSSNQQDQEEATSDSESPQTVLEQAPNRRRPALGSGTKTVHRQSVQRQATVESCPVAHEPEPGGETYTRKSSAGAALGAGDVRRQSVAPASGRRQSDEQAASEEEHGCETSPEQTSESHGQQQFKTLRQRSQSVSKQSSSSAEQQHATSMNLQQRHNRDSQQTLEGTSESRASLQRQESSSTNASSLATTASSGYFMAAASDGEAGEPVADQQDDEEEAQPRRRSSSQQRSRAKSRPRHSAANQHEQDYDKDVTTINKPNSHQDTPLARRRSSRSQPPVARREAAARNNSNHQTAILIHVRHQSNYQNNHELDPKRACSVSPSLAQSVNIRHVLENVAQVDGPFAEPQLALKVAMDALESPCWSTKVEGLLALVRLVAHHPGQVLAEPGRLHEIVTRTVDETRNLRSTVARSAIFALGDFCARLKRSVEPEMEQIVQALLSRASENTTFIRDDIRRALSELVEHLTPWRLANLLIAHGAQHKSAHVRRMTSQFVAKVVLDRLGPAKALVGAREISQALLPAVARFAQDQSPHTRYYGRLILSKLMQHSSFERLTRRHLSSTLYRSTLGILESIKRRGVGALPDD